VSGYDAFSVITPPHNLEALAKIYELSPPHYAAVNAKVDNIVGLGFNFVESAKTKRALENLEGSEKKLKKVRQTLDEHREDLYQELEDMNEEETFTEIMIKVWRDYEVTGNGYIEVGRKRDGTIGYIGHIAAQTIRVRRQRDGFVQISANQAQFFSNFGDSKTNNPIGSGAPNELIHIKRYSPTSSYYGVPDVVAAQQAIAGNEFAARFNLEFFENKAVPRHLITLKGANLSATAQAGLLSFFETGLKGQNHRSLFIPLPADNGLDKVEFSIEAIDAKVQESSFDRYVKANNNQILMAHRVPITKVSTGDGATLAIARDADKTFKEQVCGPQQKVFEKKLNRIIKEMTDAFELKLNEMTLTDEDTQSKIDERRIKTGTETANEQRIRRGLPGLPGGDELVDLNAKDKIAQAQAEMTTNRERDAQRSAGASDSAGESRQPKGEGRATA
jgi:PBSX family phage portal protein